MVAVGLIYLIFEDKILGDSSLDPKVQVPRNNHLSRALIGIQVGYPVFSYSQNFLCADL